MSASPLYPSFDFEGPVFRGDRVRWDAFEGGTCRVPDDAVGAPGLGGH